MKLRATDAQDNILAHTIGIIRGRRFDHNHDSTIGLRRSALAS
jgi:hypothetical protein